jgi:hypothetical protein
MTAIYRNPTVQAFGAFGTRVQDIRFARVVQRLF